MQHTPTQKILSAMLLGAILSAPLSASAMWLDPQKKQLICQERALVAQERQIESFSYLVDRSKGRFNDQLKQFSQDLAFVESFPQQVDKLIADVLINYTNIVTSNITLDLAGLKALISIVKNALTMINKIQSFITRVNRIIYRWEHMDKTLKREFNMIMSYINSIKNMTYTKTLQRCQKW